MKKRRRSWYYPQANKVLGENKRLYSKLVIVHVFMYYKNVDVIAAENLGVGFFARSEV